MKAPAFDYVRPGTLDEALAMMGAEGAMALAGGQSLMPMLNFRVAAPETLVDLGQLEELRGITADGRGLRIGAMTCWVDLMASEDIARVAPLMAMALPHIAHDAVRNRGTLGGSLALADPAAEMPAVCLALDAVIEVASQGGTRELSADDFFTGAYETALKEGELITGVRIPPPAGAHGFHELAQRHGDYALAGVALARHGDAVRVAFFGICDRAIRVPAIEAALAADMGDPAAAAAHLADVQIDGDLKADAGTRRRLAGVALERAVEGMA